MDRTTLATYYKKSVVYPWLLMMLLITVYAIIETANYKSEWLTSSSIVKLTIMVAFFYGLAMCLLALPIFLNIRLAVRTNRFLSAVSWFFLPFALIGFVINRAVKAYMSQNDGSDLIYSLILNAPFMFGLVWGFCLFQRAQKRQKHLF